MKSLILDRTKKGFLVGKVDMINPEGKVTTKVLILVVVNDAWLDPTVNNFETSTVGNITCVYTFNMSTNARSQVSILD